MPEPLPEAFDTGYVEGEKVAELKALYDETGRTLNGYMRYVKSKIPLPPSGKDPEPGIVEESGQVYGSEDAESNRDFLQVLKIRE